jgi:hypothetical protein
MLLANFLSQFLIVNFGGQFALLLAKLFSEWKLLFLLLPSEHREFIKCLLIERLLNFL